MARKLRQEEANVFNENGEVSPTPGDIEALLRKLLEQEESSQSKPMPRVWIGSIPPSGT